jgi:hypothetical protein
MAIQFPSVSGLSDGATQVINDVLYTLHKTSDTVFYWSASQADNPDTRYVLVTGDNMTGSLGGVTTFDADNLTAGSTTMTMTDVLTTSTGTGVAAWAHIDIDGTVASAFNCSVSKVSTGLFDVTFDTALRSSDYAVAGSIIWTSASGGTVSVRGDLQTTGFQVQTVTTSNAVFDYSFSFIVVGGN